MTDWTDEVAAANAVTRNAVRQLIDYGLATDPASLDTIFDESRVDFGKADLAPVINVTVNPTIEVNPTPVHVDAPIVNIAQAEAKAAMVIPAPIVNITPEFAITSLPDRVSRRTVKRDKAGQITETLDVESDA